MPLSRRTFLASAGAIGAATALGSGAAWSQEGDTIRVALAARGITGLMPQTPGLTNLDSFIIIQMYHGLAKNPDGDFAQTPDQFEPVLAERWESSDDARTWTYYLRPGIQFHKGYGEVTAEDVVFTFSRHLDPEIITGGWTNFVNLESVEASDAATVVFTLAKPDPMFNAAIARPEAYILSKKAFEEKGDGYNRDPIGTGPYQLEAIRENRDATVIAFPDYFGEPARTPRLQFAFMADTTARTLAFASGDADIIEGVRAPGWIDTIRGRARDTIFDVTSPGSFNLLHFDLTRAPLDDLRVRQAIRYAVDNEAIASAYGDVAQPMVGIIASQFEGSVTREELPEELRYAYDPERSKALLAEAGHAGGLTIPCYTSQREDFSSIMLIIQEQLRAVGINLNLQIIDHATFHSENRLAKNALPLSSTSYGPVPTSIFLQQLAAESEVVADGSGGSNFSHYGVAIPGIDELLAQAEEEADFDARVAIYKEIERKVLTDLPAMGVITLGFVMARHPRIDLGFEVKSGVANWSFYRAGIV